MLRTVLLILRILLLIGALPAWPYSHGWGYYPSGGLGLILIILILQCSPYSPSVNSKQPQYRWHQIQLTFQFVFIRPAAAGSVASFFQLHRTG